MKKTVFIILILLTVSCEKESKFTHEILGRWVFLHYEPQIYPPQPIIWFPTIIWEFKANGTLIEYPYSGSKPIEHKYRINDTIVTLIIGDSEQDWEYWIFQESMRLFIVEETDTFSIYFMRIEYE